MRIPFLPLRDIVVFPSTSVQLFVGRERSIRALESAVNHDKRILLVAQRQAISNDPGPDDIYSVGTIAAIARLLRLPDGTVKVLVEGRERARIVGHESDPRIYLCEAEVISVLDPEGVETEALVRSVKGAFETYIKLNKRLPPETLTAIAATSTSARTADAVAAQIVGLKLHEKQALLEETDVNQRLEQLLGYLSREIDILQVERKIRARVKKQIERNQKEYYLNEQIQAIQRELGDRDEFKNEINELETSLEAKQLTREAETRVRREIKKLKLMQPMSAEATVIRNYIDWVLALPWGKKVGENHDISHAEKVLDEDHYGLKPIKERVIEYLAVQALCNRESKTHKLRGPVLCLVGPPGVGKTSLARSIARATGRPFIRLSLGGVRDEAEIRGHRRTYIGAMPGRIVQSLRKAEANNPVFLLDEVDKMASDFRGDPAAALLEVLDREQNNAFHDHYLDLEYDLSDVMFIATANTLSGIPLPLRDRMEIIEVSSYTEFEKLNIAQRYLVPRQLEEAGLKPTLLDITPNALRAMIRHYTKEAGVRNLEREISRICRKVARDLLKAAAPEHSEAPRSDVPPAAPLGEQAGERAREGVVPPLQITGRSVPKYLGIPKYRLDRLEEQDEVGLANGLAYTSFGGTMLECEASVVPGKGKLVITGLLEKGMQESAQAAMSYIRSRQRELGLAPDFHKELDVHVHFPEFVPKDGPSAGITMAVSIASALLRIPVRRNVAMTGEITLRGRIKGIGGLKEKLLAAHRAGIDTVLIPKDNRKDLRDLPKRVLQALRIVLVSHMDQVLREALALDPSDRLVVDAAVPLVYQGGALVQTPELVPSDAPAGPVAPPPAPAPDLPDTRH